MSSEERIAQLQAMLREEPGDVFLRYAIALERKRMGAFEAAIADWEAILRDQPNHIPSYHQIALLLADMGRMDEAREACRTGMQHCIVTGDRKARAELGELLNTLEEEA